MIELIATDFNLKELLPHALYYSERTNVIAIPDSMAHLVPSCSVSSQDEGLASIVFSKKNFYLNNSTVGHKLYMGTTWGISMRDLGKLNDLLSSNVAVATHDVKNLFSLLTLDATVGDLECSKYRYRVNKKMHNFDGIRNVSLKDLFSDIVVKKKEYNNFLFKVRDVYEEVTSNKKTRGIVAGSYMHNEEIIECQSAFYGANADLARECQNGDIMRVLVNDNEKIVTFAPNGFNKTTFETVSPSKDIKRILNGLPVLLFRMLYNEYKFRELIHN